MTPEKGQVAASNASETESGRRRKWLAAGLIALLLLALAGLAAWYFQEQKRKELERKERERTEWENKEKERKEKERKEQEKKEQEKKEPPPPPNYPEKFSNDIGMTFVLIPAGCFQMGCDQATASCRSDEQPRHEVCITKPFYLAVHEVTQAQWGKVMEKNPSKFQGANRPVEGVSRNDALAFMRRLGEQDGRTYRLPTEAEWEYAARAGTTTAYSFGDNAGDLPRYGYVLHHSKDMGAAGTQEVGRLEPNARGLYDMHGNVSEWVFDRYDENYYADSPKDDPKGPETGKNYVVRGGSWYGPPETCRSAHRAWQPGDQGFPIFGFRPVLVPESVEK